MILRPPRSTRIYTLFPYTTLFRSAVVPQMVAADRQRDFGTQVRRRHLQAKLAVMPWHRRVHLVDEDDIGLARRSEEHTSELQSLMRISYAVFCLKKKNIT